MDFNNINKDRKQRRKSSLDLSTMVYGKVPPQAKDLEQAVLGAILLVPFAFDKVKEYLGPECFYVESHQRIFRAMEGLCDKRSPIDILTVIEELKFREELDIVGGPYPITILTNNVTSSANIEAHAKIIYQKFIQREIIRIGGEMISDAYEDSTDAFDLLDDSEGKLSSLSIRQNNKSFVSLLEAGKGAIQQILSLRESKGGLTGVPTGHGKLDSLTQGWQYTNLIIIAARPAVGKSAVAANLAYNAASNEEKPVPCAVFTLEMPTLQWVMRLLSAKSEIKLFDLKRGQVSDEEMKKLTSIAYSEFDKIKIFFDDTSNMTVFQLKAKVRILVLKHGVRLVIIDYLQLMSGKGDKANREQEVAQISRELKLLAKELNIAIIALSQLNREGDGSSPKLRNIRESGSIEQDADDVLFLTEPTEEDVKKDASLKDSVLLTIAKHRNGVLDKVPLKFVKSIQKLMSESDYEAYMQFVTGRSDNRWKPVNIQQTTEPKKETIESEELPF